MGVGGLLTPHCLQSCMLTASFCGVQWSQRVVAAAPTAAPRGNTSSSESGAVAKGHGKRGEAPGHGQAATPYPQKAKVREGCLSGDWDTFCPLCRVPPTPMP